MSAAIKSNGHKAKAIAVHVRLSDLSSITRELNFLRTGTAALIDKQGRLITPTVNAEQTMVDGAAKMPSLSLLHSLSDVKLDPFNSLMEEWLNAGKPLQKLHRFPSADGTQYLGSVRAITLGETELYLLLAAPEEEFNLKELEEFEHRAFGAPVLLFLIVTLLSMGWSRTGRRQDVTQTR